MKNKCKNVFPLPHFKKIAQIILHFYDNKGLLLSTWLLDTFSSKEKRKRKFCILCKVDKIQRTVDTKLIKHFSTTWFLCPDTLKYTSKHFTALESSDTPYSWVKTVVSGCSGAGKTTWTNKNKGPVIGEHLILKYSSLKYFMIFPFFPPIFIWMSLPQWGFSWSLLTQLEFLTHSQYSFLNLWYYIYMYISVMYVYK